MAMTNQLSSVQHIVHVMLENRSFDHMLGFLYEATGNVSPTGQPFDGLAGTESNVDASGNTVTVFKIDPTAATTGPAAYFMPGADPGEGYANTNSQLFGTATAPSPAVATNSGFITNFAAAITYDQNAGYGVDSGTTADDIMGIFTPSALPVLSGLAAGYAVCDQWFSSVPTETMPNRAFACAGTSQGHMDDETKYFTVQSIFGLLTANNISWKIYGYDASPLTALDFPDTTSAPAANLGLFTDFQSDAASGSLASYSFLEPSWGSSGNSQHPNYDVSLGEQFLLAIYQALQSGPAWDQTLLIITYDEHGGCYDHVAPPGGATPPDSSVGQYGFDFTRFGLRVPAVLVSPLIPAGTVFRVPEGGTPLDHTSVLKTIETRWSLPALTARDAAALDVGDVLSLTTPRTDDPMAGVTAPSSGAVSSSAGLVSHLQRVQAQATAELPLSAEQLTAGPVAPAAETESAYGDFITARTALWQSARAAGTAPPS
jgi:phospholipase C